MSPPRAYVAKLYGQLRFIRSVLRATKFSVLKIDRNCYFVGLLTIPFGLSLFRYFGASLTNFC